MPVIRNVKTQDEGAGTPLIIWPKLVQNRVRFSVSCQSLTVSTNSLFSIMNRGSF